MSHRSSLMLHDDTSTYEIRLLDESRFGVFALNRLAAGPFTDRQQAIDEALELEAALERIVAALDVYWGR